MPRGTDNQERTKQSVTVCRGRHIQHAYPHVARDADERRKVKNKKNKLKIKKARRTTADA